MWIKDLNIVDRKQLEQLDMNKKDDTITTYTDFHRQLDAYEHNSIHRECTTNKKSQVSPPRKQQRIEYNPLCTKSYAKSMMLPDDGSIDGSTNRCVPLEDALNLQSNNAILILVYWKPKQRIDKNSLSNESTLKSTPQAYSKWKRILDEQHAVYSIIKGRKRHQNTNGREAGHILQFPALVFSNPNGEKIYNQAIPLSELFDSTKNHGLNIQLVSKVDHTKILPCTTVIEFKDLLTLNIQLRDSNLHTKCTDYSALFSVSRDQSSCVLYAQRVSRLLKHLVQELEGDERQILKLLSTVRANISRLLYNNQEISQKTIKNLSNELLLDKKTKSMPTLDDLENMQHDELKDNGPGMLILNEMNDVADNFIANYSSTWSNFSGKCLEKFDFTPYYKRLKEKAPKTWSSVSASIGPRSDRSDQSCFLQLLSMIRSRNNLKLVDLSVLFSLAGFGAGYGTSSQQTLYDTKIQVHPTTYYKRLLSISDDMEKNQTKCLQDEPLLIMFYDNLQFSRKLKNQTNMKSNRFQVGTLGGWIRPYRQTWPIGTMWMKKSNGQKVQVVSSKQLEGEYVLEYSCKAVKEPEDNVNTAQAINDVSAIVIINSKTRDWVVTDVPGLSPQPTKITYNNPRQVIPKPLKMKRQPDDYRNDLIIASFLKILSQYTTTNVLGNDSVLLLFMNQVRKNEMASYRERLYKDGSICVGDPNRICSFFVARFLEFDETSIAGTANVKLNMLETSGHLKFSTNRKEISPGPNDGQVFMFGDLKTMKNSESLKQLLLEYSKELDDPDSIDAINAVLDRVTCFIGDFHVCMALLDSTFRYCYGGFLQAIQAALGWKRICQDVSKCYQSARQLMMIVLEQANRKLYQQWENDLHKETFEVSEGRTTVQVNLVQLLQYANDQIASCLSSSWSKFIARKSASKDKVVRFVMRFREIANYFVEYEAAISRGDPIAVELAYPDLLPVFAALQKDNYTDFIFAITDSMYVQCSATSLEESRINRFVKLNQDSDFLSLDGLNELFNGKLANTQDGTSELKGKQSLILALADVCRRFVCPLLTGKKTPECRKSQPIDNGLNRRIVSSFIDTVLEEHDGRILRNDTFWEMVEPIREKFTAEAKKLEKDHKKVLLMCEPVVNEIFNKLSKKPCEPMAERSNNNEEGEEGDDHLPLETFDVDYNPDEEGIAMESTTLDSDSDAKRILNMKRYSFHDLAFREESISDIGKQKVKKLKAKREKKRHETQLLKDIILDSHAVSLADKKQLNKRMQTHDEILKSSSTKVTPSWRKRAREMD